MSSQEYFREYRNRNRDKLRDYMREYRQKHPGYQKRWLTEFSKIRLRFYSSLKDRPCLDCGQSFSEHSMEFDHCRGNFIRIKVYRNSPMMRQLGFGTIAKWRDILNELYKVDIVCANCHGVRGYLRRKGFQIAGKMLRGELVSIIGDAAHLPDPSIFDIIGDADISTIPAEIFYELGDRYEGSPTAGQVPILETVPPRGTTKVCRQEIEVLHGDS